MGYLLRCSLGVQNGVPTRPTGSASRRNGSASRREGPGGERKVVSLIIPADRVFFIFLFFGGGVLGGFGVFGAL